MSKLLPVRVSMLAGFLTLCAATCACTAPMQLTQPASPCIKILLASGLLDETAGAPLDLIDGTAGGLGAHDAAQTGQLVRANIDKATAKKIGTSCDEQWDAAVTKAKPRKWWKFW